MRQPVRMEGAAAGKTTLNKTSRGEVPAASADQINNAKPSDICAMAISYDDKLGLRIFAGNVDPVPGVAPCG